MLAVVLLIVLIALLIIRSRTSVSSSNVVKEPVYIDNAGWDYRLNPVRRTASNVHGATMLILAFLVVFILSPLFSIILLPFLMLSYLHLSKSTTKKGDAKRRQDALYKAGAFLSPYKNIWNNLTLSNKYCSLKLQSNGKTIVGFEKASDPYQPYRTFRIIESSVFNNNELWNLFCINFAYNTSYDGLLELCDRFRVSIYNDIVTPELPKRSKPVPKNEVKVDINNASEAEITALPGISIVIAKKIMKKREEIGGFKSVQDVLIFAKLNKNVSQQLESRICVNKMKGTLKIIRTAERQIDL